MIDLLEEELELRRKRETQVLRSFLPEEDSTITPEQRQKIATLNNKLNQCQKLNNEDSKIQSYIKQLREKRYEIERQLAAVWRELEPIHKEIVYGQTLTPDGE